MLASKIVSDARGEADLVNSAFITHADETANLNAAYKDLYAEITKNDDDYFLSESTVTITAGMKSAGTDNEYLVPLPADFWKLRYMDYATNNRWARMERFSLNLKNDQPAEPMYRFRDQKLWVIMGTFPGAGGQLKIGYYPMPATLSVPQDPITYGASISLSDFVKISSPFYVPSARTMLYVYDSLNLKAESADTGVTTALYTAATAVTNLAYYKGYVYYIRAADIWRAPTTLLATIVPAQITTLGNVTSFTVHHDIIVFNDGTNMKTCALDGTGIVTLGAMVGTNQGYLKDASDVFHLVYRTPAGAVISGAFTIVASGISYLATDPLGEYLYVVDTANHLRRLTVELVGFTATADETIAEDVKFLGNANQYGGTLLREGQGLRAISLYPDTDLSYPLNALFECMVMQLAVDFKRKQNQEAAGQAARLAGLRETLRHQLKRDEYKAERIQNAYDRGSWRW